MSADNPGVLSKKIVGQSSTYVTNSTPQNGTARDVTGFRNLCATVAFGDVTPTAAETITIKLQAGDASNGSDAADIPGATTTAITVSNGIDSTVQACILVDLMKINKKYIRSVITLSGASTLMACMVIFELGGRDVSITSSDYPQFIRV